MVDEQEFRRRSEAAIEQLKKQLLRAEETADFEVEEQNGVMNIVFDDGAAKFVVTPNAPVQQIWISALSTSFKLDLSPEGFVLAKTNEPLGKLVERLLSEQLGEAITL